MFITYGWYVDGWWKDSNDGNCTGDELADMLLYTMGPIIREIPDDDVIGEPGIVSYNCTCDSIVLPWCTVIRICCSERNLNLNQLLLCVCSIIVWVIIYTYFFHMFRV